jgi:hypothetical protein
MMQTEASDEPVAIYRAGQAEGEVFHIQFLQRMEADEVLLYAAPVQRKPLTDEEILTYRYMIDWTADWSYIKFARAIEAAHGITGDNT